MATTLSYMCRFEIMEWNELSKRERLLLMKAIRARNSARADVSGFKVGAAIETEDDRLFIGCNIEEFTHNGCIHAEMGALSAMIAQGHGSNKIRTVAIALGNANDEITIPPQRTGEKIESLSQVSYTPCGHCRTVLSQHQTATGMTVLALQPNGQILFCSMNDLYPLGFGFTPSK